jgi:hypothetical protein
MANEKGKYLFKTYAWFGARIIANVRIQKDVEEIVLQTEKSVAVYIDNKRY